MALVSLGVNWGGLANGGSPLARLLAGLEEMGGDCIANKSSPKNKAAMRKVLILVDFSLAKAAKRYSTLKEQQLGNYGPVKINGASVFGHYCSALQGK